jgi:hypothetical protein
MNKRYLVAVPIMLMCLMASAAHAEPTQWADNRVAIPAGETVELGAAGPATIRTLSATGRLILYAKCTVTSTQTFRNEEEHGKGEIKAIAFTGCTDTSKTGICAHRRVKVLPTGAWPTILEASPTLYLDEWHNVALDLRCGSIELGVSTGTLTPKIGDVDDAENCEDDIDDHLLFGQKRGTLTEPVSGDKTVFIAGSLDIEGKHIQAQRLPCNAP